MDEHKLKVYYSTFKFRGKLSMVLVAATYANRVRSIVSSIYNVDYYYANAIRIKELDSAIDFDWRYAEGTELLQFADTVEAILKNKFPDIDIKNKKSLFFVPSDFILSKDVSPDNSPAQYVFCLSHKSFAESIHIIGEKWKGLMRSWTHVN